MVKYTMKFIEVLYNALEKRGGWHESALFYAQDKSGRITAYGDEPKLRDSCYVSSTFLGYLSNTDFFGSKSSDWDTSVISKEQFLKYKEEKECDLYCKNLAPILYKELSKRGGWVSKFNYYVFDVHGKFKGAVDKPELRLLIVSKKEYDYYVILNTRKSITYSIERTENGYALNRNGSKFFKSNTYGLMDTIEEACAALNEITSEGLK